MDGVPGFNQFKGIKPQADFVYRFKVKTALIGITRIPKARNRMAYMAHWLFIPKIKSQSQRMKKTDRDYVVMLSDFHPSSSDQILKNLKKSSEYYQNQRETFGRCI